MADEPLDSIPLHEINTETVIDTHLQKAAEEPGDVLQHLCAEDESIPDAFNKRLLLSLPPALSDVLPATSEGKRTQDRRALAIVSCVWVCFFVYILLTTLTSWDRVPRYLRWTPTLLASTVALYSSHIGHKDMLRFSSHAGHRSTYEILLFVICLLAPVLNTPTLSANGVPSKYQRSLREGEWAEMKHQFGGFSGWHPRFQTVTGSDELDSGYYPMSYKTLSSWTQLVNTTNFWSPILSQPYFPTAQLAAGRWVISNIEGFQGLPSSTTFTLHRNGMGPEENSWNHDSLGEFHAVILPVILITEKPPGPNAAVSRGEVGSKALTMNLECDFINLKLDKQVEVTNSSLVIDVVDVDGCSGQVKLGKQVLPYGHDGIANLLARVRTHLTESTHNDTNLRQALEYVDSYGEKLGGDSTIVTYHPAWNLAKPSQEICRRKIIMAATSRAVFTEQDTLEELEIQAATCTPHYQSRNGTTVLTQYLGNNRLQNEIEPSFSTHRVDFDDFLVWGGWNELSPEDQLFHFCEDFLYRHVMTLASKPEIGPEIPVYLQNELSDFQWGRPTPIGALVMSSRFIRSSFAEGVSSASAIALEEALQDGGSILHEHKLLFPTMEWFPDPAGMVILIFLTIFMYSIFRGIALLYHYGGLIYLICRTIAASRKLLQDFSACSDLELPVDRQSLAARAALLCDSRVLKWLRDARDPSVLGPLASRLFLGLWSVDENQGRSGLRIEFLNTSRKECESGGDERSWTHNACSLPKPFQTRSLSYLAALLSMFAILLLLQTASLWPRIIVPWRAYPVINLLLARENHAVARTPWQSVYLYILPASMAFFFAFIWWPWLYVFYCGRQPWASLKTAQQARFSLTLDYYSTAWPLRKAIKNRHWVIAFLCVGKFLNMSIPLLMASLYQPYWHFHSLDNITGTRAFNWANDFEPQNEFSGYNFDHALRDMLDGLENVRRVSRWSSYRGAFLPVDLDGNTDDSGLWTLPTSVLIGNLECNEVSTDLHTVPAFSDGSAVHVKSVKLLPPNIIGERRYELRGPCGLERAPIYEQRPLEKGSSPKEAFCGRWWILEPEETTGSNATISLAIVWVSGSAQRDAEDHDIYFTTLPTSIGLICKPMIKKGTGNLTISSADFSLSNATLFEYSQTHEEVLDDAVGAKIARGLMTAANEPKRVFTNGTLANTPKFRGDIPSFAFYRFFFLRSLSVLNATTLARGSSAVFSAYLSAFAQGSDMFKDPVNQTISIQPLRIDYRFGVNKAVAVVVWLFILLWAATLLFLGIVPKAYRLPVAPEPLINSLFLLAQGSLVETIEERIPHADRLSPRAVINHMRMWDEKFKLGVLDVDGITKYAVDFEDNVEDEMSNNWMRYRDNDVDAETTDDNDRTFGYDDDQLDDEVPDSMDGRRSEYSDGSSTGEDDGDSIHDALLDYDGTSSV